LANAYIEQKRYSEALNVFLNHQALMDTCLVCSPDLMLDFNHSLLLSRIGQRAKAHAVMTRGLTDPRNRLRAFGHSMLSIIDFYLGAISADSIEQVMVDAGKQLQRQSYLNNQYFYLALAYLYNLKPGYQVTPDIRKRAIAHLKRYEATAIKHDVEFSLARVELKRLAAVY
jgi:hypothetical protein